MELSSDWITPASKDFYDYTKKQAVNGLDAKNPAPFEKMAGLKKAPTALVKAPDFGL